MTHVVPILPVNRVVERLARLELQQKSLGLINHAYGIRLAIHSIQVAAAEALLVEPPAPAADAIGAMVASLTTTTSSTTTPPAAADSGPGP